MDLLKWWFPADTGSPSALVILPCWLYPFSVQVLGKNWIWPFFLDGIPRDGFRGIYASCASIFPLTFG